MSAPAPTVRTRFAPSPTGSMHIGGMRTALFNWLHARHHREHGAGGTFVLRVDDTDRARNLDEALGPILDAFRWLGLDWDEGPEVGGPHGPYFQSERTEIYATALDKLLAAGLAYKDFDSRERVAADRDAAQKAGTPYVTVRRSLELSDTERERLEADGTPFVVRFLVPRGETVAIDDAVRDRVEWDTSLLPDPVIARQDGSVLYNFATTVDDAAMAITDVIRAEEHLSNTPVQVLLARALGHEPPRYAHIPFVTAPGTTKKLSKRDIGKYRNNPVFKKMFERADEIFPQIGLDVTDAVSPVMVAYYESIGYRPAAVINALGRLGWSLDDKTEIFSLGDLVRDFTLDRVVKNPAGLDPDKLFNFQSHWMNETPRDEKVSLCGAFLEKAKIAFDADFLGRLIDAMGDRLKLAADILDVAYFFADEIEYDPKAFKKRVAKAGVPEHLRAFTDERLASLADADWTPARLEAELTSFSEAAEKSPGLLIHALRVATTGAAVGPGVYDCLDLVGREKSLARVDAALANAADA
ncbi:MAG: glutamate--tRNA ligase family protein [Planctomycetota bacterium]